jgi:hypothetical protein
VPCRRRAEHISRADRGVDEIGEHTVDAEQVKLEILLCRVEPEVGSTKIGFVAEGVGMDEKTSLVGVSDQIRGRQKRPIGTLRHDADTECAPQNGSKSGWEKWRHRLLSR